MADTQQRLAPIVSLRLNMPEPTFEPIVPSDLYGSSPEEGESPPNLQEEDIQSVVGPSMSRAQSRMMSPQTPAAEKAAALENSDGGGFFDGVADDKLGELDSVHSELVDELTPSSHLRKPQTPPSGPTRASLPSPWRASPKQFEKVDSKHQDHASGPTMFSSVRSHSRNETRRKRASTVDVRPVGWSPTNSNYHTQRHLCAENRPAGSERTSYKGLQQSMAHRRVRSHGQSSPTRSNIQQGASIDSSSHQQQHPHTIRRSTSDQSLLLRRATSTVSSLGDDTRWENVREQVNSRMKAIQDSLQDSSIKLPSMPNMPSFSP